MCFSYKYGSWSQQYFASASRYLKVCLSKYCVIFNFMYYLIGLIWMNKKSDVTTNEPQHDKTNKMTCAPSEDSICPIWSESSLCAQYVAKDHSFLHADSENFDQTGWKLSLQWVHMPFCWFCCAAAQIALWSKWNCYRIPVNPTSTTICLRHCALR